MAKYDPEVLSAAFLKLEISQKEAAAELGVSYTAFNAIINGNYSKKNSVTKMTQKIIDWVQAKTLDQHNGVIAIPNQSGQCRRLPASTPFETAARIHAELKQVPPEEHFAVLSLLVKMLNPHYNLERR